VWYTSVRKLRATVECLEFAPSRTLSRAYQVALWNACPESPDVAQEDKLYASSSEGTNGKCTREHQDKERAVIENTNVFFRVFT
jgi:hypothetical protein